MPIVVMLACTRFDSVKSIRRYLPPNGNDAVVRWMVKSLRWLSGSDANKTPMVLFSYFPSLTYHFVCADNGIRSKIVVRRNDAYLPLAGIAMFESFADHAVFADGCVPSDDGISDVRPVLDNRAGHNDGILDIDVFADFDGIGNYAVLTVPLMTVPSLTRQLITLPVGAT